MAINSDGREVTDPVVDKFLMECFQAFIRCVDRDWPNAVYPITTEESKGWVISTEALGFDAYSATLSYKSSSNYVFSLYLNEQLVSTNLFKTIKEFEEILFNIDTFIQNLLGYPIFKIIDTVDDIALYAIYKVVCDKINEKFNGVARTNPGRQASVIRTCKNEQINNYWINVNMMICKSSLSQLNIANMSIDGMGSSEVIDYLYNQIMSDLEPLAEVENVNPNEVVMASEFDKLTILDLFGGEITVNDKTDFEKLHMLRIDKGSDSRLKQTYSTTSEYLVYIYLKNGYKFNTPIFASDISDGLSLNNVLKDLLKTLNGKLIVFRNRHISEIFHDRKIINCFAYEWNRNTVH